MAENNVPASSSTLPNNSFHPFSTVVNIKLDRTNYPLWLAQILPILKSRDLMGYVDGTLVCPPKIVTGATTLNPAYTTWVQQDQMILSWINGSLTATLVEMDEAPLHPLVVLKEATTHAIIIISAILQVILKDLLHMVIALFAKSAANLDIPLLTATTA
ncbi:hypothetical protein TB2_032854 [Malus domestica]